MIRYPGTLNDRWRDGDLWADVPGSRPSAARSTAIAWLAATAVRIGRRAVPYLLATAFLAGLALATFGFWSRSDLDLFRWPMAELALHGRPLFVYTVHAGIWRSDNGPLTLPPLTAVVAAVNALGWQADAPLRDALVMGLFGVFALAFAREAGRVVESTRGHPLPRPMATWSAFLLAPPLWIGMVSYGHAELPLGLWLVLLTVRQLGRDCTAVAGGLLGLALLAQTTVLLAALPLVLLLVVGRRLRAAAVLLGTAAIVVAAGLLPFLLADGRDLIASLLTSRGQAPALGGSVWALFPPTPVAAFIQHDDALVVGAGAVVLTWLAVRRGEATIPGVGRVYALMALSTACLPLLAKSVWPYYLVSPCTFATVWWLARPGSAGNWRLCVPALFSAAAIARLGGAPALCVSLPIAAAMALLLADLFGVGVHSMTAKPRGHQAVEGPSGARARQGASGPPGAVSRYTPEPPCGGLM